MGTPKLYIIMLRSQPQVSTSRMHLGSVVLLIRSFSKCGHIENIFFCFLLHLHPQFIENRWPELGCEACQGPCLYLKISSNKLRACSVHGGMYIYVPGHYLLHVCFIFSSSAVSKQEMSSEITRNPLGHGIINFFTGNRSLRQFREGYFCNCTLLLWAALDLYCILKTHLLRW